MMDDEFTLSTEQLARNAEADGRAYALEVLAICRQYGFLELAAEQIKSRASLPDIKDRLQKRRAAADTVTNARNIEDRDVELERVAAERFAQQSGVY